VQAIEVIVQVAVLHFVASTSPGPDIFLVLGNSMRDGARAGVATAAGIVSGVAMQIALCIGGLAVLVAENPALHRVLIGAGGGWLVYIGVRAMLPARNAGPVASATTAPRAAHRSHYAQGLITNLLNVKALLFFLALFTYVMDPALPLWVKLACGVEMVTVQMLSFGAIALLAGSQRFRSALGNYHQLANRAMSLILVLFGTILLYAAGSG